MSNIQRGEEFTTTELAMIAGLNALAISSPIQAIQKTSATTFANVLIDIDPGSAVWGSITGTLSDQTDLQLVLDGKAALAGATFTGDVIVPNEVYGAGWDGSYEVPTKDALYDKIQTLVAGGATVALDNLAGVAINTALLPGSSDTIALGSTSKQWSDLFLGEGGVINWDSGDVTLTQTGNELALAGGDFALGANNITMTGSLGATGARLTKGWFTDLEVTNAIVGSITGNAATVTTNANLTGPITSVGNATSIASSVALPGSPTTTTQTPADNSTKIATTAYVENAVLGQNFKTACKYATTAALAASLYDNGASGVGATLTEVGLGALSVDSNTPSVGDRILVKNQVSTFENGIYTVTVVGSAGASFVLTRSLDANQVTDWNTGDSTFITAGTTLSTTTWAYNGTDDPVIGTDAITFAQTAGQGSFTAGNGITITGVSIAIDTAVTADLTTVQALTNKTYNGNTWTAGTGVLTIAAGKTLTVSNTITLAGTDGKGINVGAATSRKILVGDGSNMILSTETYAVPGTSGNVLTSDGTNWTSATPTSSGYSPVFALEEDGNGDLQPITGTPDEPAFDLDGNSDIQPTVLDYEDVGGNIVSESTPIDLTNPVFVSMTAGENLKAGNPVGVSNYVANTVSRGYRPNATLTLSYTKTNGLSNPNYSCKVGDNKFAFMDAVSGTNRYVVTVGTINQNTKTITLGNTVIVTSDNNNLNYGICKLDTDKIAVFYVDAATNTVIKYRVGTIAGNSLSFGQAATFTTAGSAIANLGFTADYISADKGVMVYKCSTATNSRAIVFTASGDVVTGGTPIAMDVNLDDATETIVRTIGTDKFIIVSTQSDSAFAQVGTCIGTTTITLGSAVQYASTLTGTNGYFQVVSPDTDVVVIKWRNSGGGSNDDMIAGTVSGTVITFGTVLTTVTTGAGGMCAESSTSILISNSTTSLIKITRSGTTLTNAGAIINNMGTTAAEAMYNLNGYPTIIASAATTVFTYWTLGMSNNYIGIAQDTVSAGSSVNVLIKGIDSNQTGLLTGGWYLVSDGGLTFATSVVTVNTQDDLAKVMAISSTQIVV